MRSKRAHEWTQVDGHGGRKIVPLIVGNVAQDEFQRVVQAWLSNDHAVHGQRSLECSHPVRIPRQRQYR